MKSHAWRVGVLVLTVLVTVLDGSRPVVAEKDQGGCFACVDGYDGEGYTRHIDWIWPANPMYRGVNHGGTAYLLCSDAPGHIPYST